MRMSHFFCFSLKVYIQIICAQGETTWFVSYPKRTDINLSKVPSCALCLTAAIHEQLSLSVHKNGALTCLQCTSRLRPESPLTDKWQQRVSRCFAHSVQKTLTDTSRTHNHKRTTWQVQLTPCFYQQLCPTSPLQPERWSEWQMTAKVWCLLTLVFVFLHHCCHPALSCSKK